MERKVQESRELRLLEERGYAEYIESVIGRKLDNVKMEGFYKEVYEYLKEHVTRRLQKKLHFEINKCYAAKGIALMLFSHFTFLLSCYKIIWKV